MIYKILIAWLVIANIIAFMMYGADKRRAKKGKWRITERALILSAVVGGSIGALFGMKVFRHKTKHKKFTIGVPAILVLQIIAAVALWLLLRG